MARNLQVFGRASIRLDEDIIQAGSTSIPVNIAVTGTKYDSVFSIANATNTVVFNNQLTTFTFLYLASDQNTRALLTDTAGNTFSISLRGTAVANTYGIPFMLGKDDTKNTNVYINTIRVFNISGSTAKVRCLVLK